MWRHGPDLRERQGRELSQTRNSMWSLEWGTDLDEQSFLEPVQNNLLLGEHQASCIPTCLESHEIQLEDSFTRSTVYDDHNAPVITITPWSFSASLARYTPLYRQMTFIAHLYRAYSTLFIMTALRYNPQLEDVLSSLLLTSLYASHHASRSHPTLFYALHRTLRSHFASLYASHYALRSHLTSLIAPYTLLLSTLRTTLRDRTPRLSTLRTALCDRTSLPSSHFVPYFSYSSHHALRSHLISIYASRSHLISLCASRSHLTSLYASHCASRSHFASHSPSVIAENFEIAKHHRREF